MIKLIKRVFGRFKRNKKNMSASYIIPDGIIIKDDQDNRVPDKVLGDTDSKKSKKKVRQYTKCFVTAITIAAMCWISASYVFAGYALFVYGETQLLAELSEQVCITLLGLSLGYFLKAWGETYAEKKNELDNKRLDFEVDTSAMNQANMNQEKPIHDNNVAAG